ncbi:unnamed protein product [Caenorhabditis angaria]|uniref:BPL/LPL catalytic domain-containing protein n=1 Tax=Caenorhabditis angaria TaxID=860376 RepID=A0A9P1I9X8_9PELO|nr:unnamed protein product [Caenorhabditis angaria]
MFVEIVDAFSEHLLIDENFRVVQICSMFAPPQDDRFLAANPRNLNLTSSTLSLAVNQEKPLPILQHLFWGDMTSSQQFLAGNSTENLEIVRTSPRKSRKTSPPQNRRRYHSCNSPEIQISPKFTDFFTENYSNSEEFRSLPRYIRGVSKSPRNSIFDLENHSLPRYIRQLNENFSSEDISIQTTTATNSESFCSENSKFDIENEKIRMIDETDTETIDSSRIFETKIDKSSEAILKKQEVRLTFEENGENFKKNGKIEKHHQEPSNSNSHQKNQRSTSIIPANSINFRRFSAFPEAENRGRSVSPSAFELYQTRSLRGFTKAAGNRSSSRQNPRQIRQYFTAPQIPRKSMAKPDSVLVYTAGNAELYQEIRQKLSQFLAPDEITVFNVTIEAIRKQPWNEKSTICVILASTNELDDEAWQRIQDYFNCNGKIIFVCQNQLLASITHSTSNSSKQDLFRFAFDTKTSKLKENNKDFAKFLEKNLKSLKKQPKHAINETYCAKKSGANFSVVLKKDNDTPLFLYMQNLGCSHASVLFSDATTQELLAPNSNLLRDSLQSVGLKIAQNRIPSLTRAVMTSEFASEIDEIPGLRLGTNIGSKPELLLRRSEIVEKEGLPEPNREFLPIEIVGNPSENSVKSFDFKEYFNTLTSKIGAVLVYSEVMTTTMDVCESLNNSIPSQKSIIVIANRQISGRGRGGNEFISPEGCALFTFSFFIEKSSRFARCVPILQHVFCVALVEAAKNLSFAELPLRIKWPNDLYFERSHKVGGMLICCKSRDDGFLVQIGCGINVTNEKPTICLNDMIPAELKSGEKKIHISREKLIAETLNRFQWYLNDYETNGPSKFRQKYYEFWLHSQQEILLADFNERVQIRGIDDYGYLQVRSKTNPEKIFSIGDDGNTFDMMKGLIRHKF